MFQNPLISNGVYRMKETSWGKKKSQKSLNLQMLLSSAAITTVPSFYQ